MSSHEALRTSRTTETELEFEPSSALQLFRMSQATFEASWRLRETLINTPTAVATK